MSILTCKFRFCQWIEFHRIYIHLLRLDFVRKLLYSICCFVVCCCLIHCRIQFIVLLLSCCCLIHCHIQNDDLSCCCCCCLIHCRIQFVVLSFILSLLSYSLSHSIWLLLKTFSTTNLDTLAKFDAMYWAFATMWHIWRNPPQNCCIFSRSDPTIHSSTDNTVCLILNSIVMPKYYEK